MPEKFPRRIRSSCALVATAAALGLASGVFADVVFVRANQLLPTAFQTGTSWGTAFKSLQSALAEATTGDEIWIAQGTYRPTTTGDRSVSFVLKSGVHLLGGFAGTETFVSERSILAFPTVLSGEIGGPSLADNSFHVITASSLAANTIVDGVTITRGNADGAPSMGHNVGSAVNALDARVTLSSCVIRDNFSLSGTVASATSLADRTLTCFQCVVTGNLGARAIVPQGVAPTAIIHCTITHNAGGILYFSPGAGTSQLSNSILYFNGDGSEGEQFLPPSSGTQPSITACLIQGWDNVSPASATTLGLNPLLRDPDGLDDIGGNEDDVLTLLGSSPAIDRGHTGFIGFADPLDLDDDGVTIEVYPFDLAGNPRRVDDPLVANTGGGGAPHADVGAFEFVRPRTVFVDKDATGANNGTNWSNAYTLLQSAIQELNDPKFGGDGEIWVAEGTYKPTTGSDTTISFIPGAGLHLFGGFIGNGPGGNELDRSLRDWQAHPTILSGELGGAGTSDNSRHVVLYTGPFATDTLLDGFQIRDGVATLAGGPGGGIAILNDASPVIRNCLIANNIGTSNTGGGGIFIGGTTVGTAEIVDCIVVDNGGGATGPGGGILVAANGAAIYQCLIAGNKTASSGNGGGVHFTTDQSTAIIDNCAIFDNTGGILELVENQVRHIGGGLVLMRCCSIDGFTGPIAGFNAISCFGFSPSDLIDANGADNIYGTSDDDYRLSACSNLIDAGSTTALPGDIGDLDLDGTSIEVLPLDFGARPRRVEMPVPNSGIGSGVAIDVGPFEFQLTDLPDADFNDDGAVDATDLAILLGAWLAVGGEHDLNGDCTVDASDLAILLGAWG